MEQLLQKVIDQARTIENLEQKVAKLQSELAAAKKKCSKHSSSGGASATATKKPKKKSKRVTTTPKPTECPTCKVVFPSKKAANTHWSDKSNTCGFPSKPKARTCAKCKKACKDIEAHLRESPGCRTKRNPSKSPTPS